MNDYYLKRLWFTILMTPRLCASAVRCLLYALR